LQQYFTLLHATAARHQKRLKFIRKAAAMLLAQAPHAELPAARGQLPRE
jgi:hypothetical protein